MDLLTVHEVARIFRVDDTTVRRWIKGGALKAIVLPHNRKRLSYRVPQNSVNDIMGVIADQGLPAFDHVDDDVDDELCDDEKAALDQMSEELDNEYA